MRVTVAIDSLKGSLTSLRAGEAARRGVLAACPEAEVSVFPLADGGEGTVRALTAEGGRRITATVGGPLGKAVTAEYGILADGTAVIEMAAAAGLPLLAPEERDPTRTTTFGVGELIADALDRGCRRLLIGIGGSATNDGGAGMLEALGFRLLDREGRQIPRGGAALASLSSVDATGALPLLSECEITVASDVENPLCGERGASAVFGPQKGASPADVALLDGALSQFARISAEHLGRDLSEQAGAGAAGGLGFALIAYLGARITSGVSLVIERTGLAAAIAASDLVITGEGRLDGQSALGKAPVGVAREAKKNAVTTLAVGGAVTEEAERLHELGIDALFPILDAPCTLAEAMDSERAERNIERTVREAVRLYLAAKSSHTANPP